MRRTTLLLVMMGFLLVVASAVALAANKTGTNKGETLTGTPDSDKLAGGGGDDILKGQEGDDYLFGDWGDDTLIGGPGDDFLNVADGKANDVIAPGGNASSNSPGDTCVADVGDQVEGPLGLLSVPTTAGVYPAFGNCEQLTVVQQA